MARTGRATLARLASVPLSLALAVSAATAVVTASPAAASSSLGGVINRSEVLQRAQYWVDKGYTYNTNGSKADPQGRSYRTDCSGLVSMTWHLKQSYTTADFIDTSGKYPWKSVSGGLNSLQPGDAMVRRDKDNTEGHIELFVAWKSATHSDGAYVYSFNMTGYTVENPLKPNNKGFLGFDKWSEMNTYKPIRYNNIRSDGWALPTEFCTYKVISGPVNERAGPGTANPVMTTRANGLVIQAGENGTISADGNTWRRASDLWGADGDGGWIAYNYLQKTAAPCFS